MTFTKALPCVAAAALVLLGTSHGPTERASLVGLPRTNIGGVWFVRGDDSDSEDDVVDDEADSSGSGKAPQKNSEEADREGLDDPEEKLPGFLRGTPGRKSSSGSKSSSIVGPDNAFHELLKSLSADGAKDSAVERAIGLDNLSKLLDRIFPPRLQTAPKYQGALECLNEELNRDILRGPNKDKRDPKALQQAYNFLRNPPVMLEVPAIFVELREAADREIWEAERKAAARSFERLGEPVPAHLLLSADEFMAREAEEPRVREEELYDEEIQRRLVVINGWLKQQFRLRLYYRKRIGTLKGNPQDLLVTFDASPDYVVVSVEDIEGLSYGAELDPEPVDEEEENNNDGELAQRTEL